MLEQNINRLKYLTYRRLSDCSSVLFPGEFFFKPGAFDFEKLIPYISGDNVGLYIHIPFCVTECLFCGCFKTAKSPKDVVKKYISYLVRELELYYKLNGGKKFKFDTIAVGGGTPSILEDEDIVILFEELYKYIDRSYVREFSVEIAPYVSSKDQILQWKSVGVTRISIGIQSFDQEVLKKNNRPFMTYESLKETIDFIKSQDIRCEGDLLIGIKGQNLETCIKDYKKTREIGLERLTVNYFFANIRVKYSDSLELLKIKLGVKKALGKNYGGYGGKKSLQDVHIEDKKGYSILGIGVGAISIFGTEYFMKRENYESYYNSIDTGIIPCDRSLSIDREYVALKYFIRCYESGSVSISKMNQRYDVDFISYFRKELDILVGKGILELQEDTIVFLKDKLYTEIYFSIFFERLLDMKKFEQDFMEYKDILTLDITLLGLIDEI